MKDWLKDLFSDSSKVSSKRVLAFLSFIVYVILVSAHVFAGVPVDPEFIYATTGLIVSLILGQVFSRGNGGIEGL